MSTYPGITANLVDDNRSNAQGWVVLVVDDEPDHLKLAAKVLGFMGAQVLLARTADEALLLLATVQPTFILLDLHLPMHDGWWLLERLRTDAHTQKIPVLAITAHVSDVVRARAKSAGFNGYVDKPFRISTLLNQIQEALAAPAIA